jgi:predicted dehydrogenase
MADQPLRIAILGAGFWARFQIAAWRELPGVEIAGLYNRTRAKAEALAAELGIPHVADDAAKLLDLVHPDVVDIITDVDTHPQFVALAASRRIPVITQKPMAPTLAQAEEMVRTCRAAGVPLFVHENFRFQTPLRAVKAALLAGDIGPVHRARIDFITGFPVFGNQPFLRELKQFILTDLGSHLLDVARCLFGEASTLYCQTQKVHADIAGEDVATVVMRMGPQRATVVVQMAYAENHVEHDKFPETCVFVEGARGSLELTTDYWLRVTTAGGTLAQRFPPPRYAWADPRYDVVHASGVPCNASILAGLRGGHAETTGADNLQTVRLVFAAYDSAARDAVIGMEHKP